MKNFTNQLEAFSFEKLEERKEFTFYFHSHYRGCGHNTHSCNPCDPCAPKSCPNTGGTPV
ncbi:hypothetical protein [Leeuwenhoekiella sp. MAR_2009_132]|uniref:hypothetical protein n=1 Tax=Leeuwenhoekiella sp. MAR_2009_132 TaxID=1392489 RepID=UPI000F65C74E|nr:hypothetical protein [Leeuwenhoekiella sp. MAR_2009_132]